jgi:acyl-homoserine-lactone acylase
MLYCVMPIAAVAHGQTAPAPQAGSIVQVDGRRSVGDISSARYEATIRRTSYGIPHIVAADLPSLGFGEGYAQAEDHLCTIADQVVRGRGERSMYFGRGEGDRHLLGDIAAKALLAQDSAGHTPSPAPETIRDWMEGFAAGYNQYLAQTGRDAVPGWCRGQVWVFRITAADLFAAARPALFAAAIARAQPPAAGGGASDASGDDGLEISRGASQGWALGRERTESGRGMLLANPHYPWGGSNRFWEKHLTIPGDFDVYGVSLIGRPGVGIGFNRAVGWTFTTSAAEQFTLYSLELVPDKPTRYRYGSDELDMTPVEIAVEVRGDPAPVRRTIWFTRYGPVINAPATGLAWSTARAFTFRAAQGRGGLAQVLAMNRAASLTDLRKAYADHGGLPGFNTVAVGADGVAWYSSAWAVPELSRDAIVTWLERRANDPATRLAWENGGLVLLDGSNPIFEWVDPRGVRKAGPGTVQDVPQLEHTDYVFNANNSFWLANAGALLEGGYSPMHGAQRTQLSLRARSNVLHLTNAPPYAAAGRDGKFNLQELQTAVLANRSLTADLLLPELVERCKATPRATVDGQDVDLTGACAVLERWDRRFDLESRGAVLVREWIGRYENLDLDGKGRLFAVDFDPADPVNTPRGLAPGSLALENLAKAATLLEGRGIALDVPLGEVQYAATKLPRRMSVHGGNGSEGVLNLQIAALGNFTTLEPLELAPRVTGSRFLTEAGYPALHGSSFVMALEYTPGGPRAMAILTYSQSGDPNSPHFTDQTELFARKEWRPILFRADAIARDVRREYTVSGPPR